MLGWVLSCSPATRALRRNSVWMFYGLVELRCVLFVSASLRPVVRCAAFITFLIIFDLFANLIPRRYVFISPIMVWTACASILLL